MSDLRGAANSHKDGRFYQSATAFNAERREARRDLRKLAKSEALADEEQLKQLKEMEQREMMMLMKLKISDTAFPSLFAVARYLIEDFAMQMPKELCQACRKPVFDNDPGSDAMQNPHHPMKPMRTFCGHWLHFTCLNEWLTTPPFLRNCPVCARRIWHPDWPEDHKALERAWQTKQAKIREVSDCADFLDMGDDFSTDAAKNKKFG